MSDRDLALSRDSYFSPGARKDCSDLWTGGSLTSVGTLLSHVMREAWQHSGL